MGRRSVSSGFGNIAGKEPTWGHCAENQEEKRSLGQGGGEMVQGTMGRREVLLQA